jgi:hypothetical protein
MQADMTILVTARTIMAVLIMGITIAQIMGITVTII